MIKHLSHGFSPLFFSSELLRVFPTLKQTLTLFQPLVDYDMYRLRMRGIF